jgi:RNA polymerase sigma factor (sigma-70 family)
MTVGHRWNPDEWDWGEQSCDEQTMGLAQLAVEIALKRHLSTTEAREVSQTAIAAFLTRREHVLNPEAYVTQVTNNLIFKLIKEYMLYRKRYLQYDEAHEVADPTHEDAFDRILNRLAAQVIFEEEVVPLLTARQLEVIDLYYGQGLSCREAAKRLGVSPENIKGTLKEVKKKARRAVNPGNMEDFFHG